MKKIAILGAASLTGEKLIEILAKHPEADVVLATSETFAGQAVAGTCLNYKPLNLEEAAQADIVFSCLPHGKSMELLPQLVKADKLVIDLGADFRVGADVFEKWYAVKHQAPDMAPATYGLSEVFTEEIAESKFIANPGCYPTSVLLALAPLLEAKIKLEDVGVFSLSGRSGAGREKAKELQAQGENAFSYKDPYGHQHIGEMEEISSKILSEDFRLFFFEPNVLCNVFQGLRSTVVGKLDLSSRDESEESLVQLYDDFYKNQPFIKFGRIETDGSQLQLKDAVNTNDCLIGLNYDVQNKRIYIISVIDNLVKGASGQAVQNMNIALWGPEQQSLGLEA